MDSDDLLASFRQEWRRELTGPSRRGAASAASSSSQSTSGGQPSFEIEGHRRAEGSESLPQLEIKAGELFKQGIWLEQNGKLYEAIKFYRRAIAMVPDIEIRVHRQHIQERMEAAGNDASSDEEYEDQDQEADDEIDMKDLVARFEALMANSQPICQPSFAQEAAHISCLPVEMLERILLWVVGQDLDLISLDRMSCVSRGFYLVCRKPDIWKRACLRVWGINVGNAEEYASWREMFLTRPRPRFNGCYISKTTYFRSGENSFQDETYQPWHIVTYYRYLRFFPNGQVVMLTSADEPQLTVSLLKKDTKASQIFQGHYRIHASSITLLFRSHNRKETNKVGRNRRKAHGTTDVAESASQMELEIKPVRGRPNWQLAWKCYSIVSCYVTGSRTTSVLDVSDPSKFPPMNYSRVKSYSMEAELPLT